MTDKPFRLYQGDCLERLKELPDNSIDSIVTDPPYGLSKQPDMAEVLRHWLDGDDYIHKGRGFMGKEWDSFVPGPSVWKECYRVLKPGGHMVTFFGTRTYDLGVLAIRLAGFEIRDQLAWVYGSGFPKSRDISKDMDKIAGAERKVIGKHSGSGMTKSNVDQGAQKRNVTEWDLVSKEPASEDGHKWSGWGTALKPAFEPIALARKPISATTVAKNVLEHGVGGINIDECRVGTSKQIPASVSKTENVIYGKGMGSASAGATGSGFDANVGRFPANLIHDGSDEVVALFPDSKGQLASVKGTEESRTGANGIYGSYGQRPTYDKREETEASAARFFYCAKASKRDRNEGLDHLPEKTKRVYGSGIHSAVNSNPTEMSGGGDRPAKNNHPTVKPTALLEHLCRLITPPGGTILDPFMGSGSTGKAAMYEGFSFIGVELMEEYMMIAEARIEAARLDAYKISIGDKKSNKKETVKEADTINKFFEE